MTTGFKLNSASDNAANYSIATSYDSKLSSLQIAQDNIEMGMDMVATAEDTISLMQEQAERIHNLITQYRNGTYGDTSKKAIVTEIQACISEVERLYNSAEYNGIYLFNNLQI
jgi:flagellin